ncbi:MAG TPA: aminotransferase class V-fold PLP-dependent enzyme [Roseiflexaceae bacterium]|nr:aminotransferase class V-fold PLP-dependent enzyme [Roseiflexaceae bacterium]
MLDDASRRRDFPSLEGMTYLNTAAEGIPPLVVGEALAQYFRDHQLGMDGRERHYAQLEAAKQLTARVYGLSSAEVAICSCSSEAYNLAALALQLRPGDEVVINDLDFPAGATPWLQPSSPATVKVWRSRAGALRVEDLAVLLGPRTRLVTSSLVSFYNGFMIPLPAVIEAVRAHSPALLALDVTQAVGRVPLNLAGVDLIISSTHKWILASHGGGLVGVPAARAPEWTVPAGGWFNLKNQVPLGPEHLDVVESQPGAPSFAVGMPNFPAIYAIRAALEYIQGVGVTAIDAAARPLVRACLDGLARLPVELLTPSEDDALAGIIAFRHPKMETLQHALRGAGVHVMAHAGRLRVALHGYNTAADVERLLDTLEEALQHVEAR